MSLAAAVTEMMEHLDAIVHELPEPLGGRDGLPNDFVVLGSVVGRGSGIGKISRESGSENVEEHSGVVLAEIDVQLWGHEGTDLVGRGRELMIQLLHLRNQKSPHGVFVKARIASSRGPDFVVDVHAWRLTTDLSVEFEYRFVEAPGVGVIEQVTVEMEGELEEDFVVTGSQGP